METFIWNPQWGAQLKQKPNVKVVKFGDGYEQRQPQGLNHNLRSYSLTFSGTEQTIQAISDFLNKHAGYQAFLWLPYGSSTQSKFKCEEWDVAFNTGFWTLNAEFKEVLA